MRASRSRWLFLAGNVVIVSLMLGMLWIGRAEPAAAPLAVSPLLEEPAGYRNNPRSLQGGGGQVWAVAVSPDGKTIASVAGGTGDNEGALTLWDFEKGTEKVTLTEFKPIRCVAFSRDGKTLATGDFGSTAKLRDPATGAVRHVLRGHTGAINSVAFTPDNKTLATGSLDHSIKLWNVADGKLLETINAHDDWVLAIAISDDGKTLASAARNKVARVWDLPSGKLRHTLLGHTTWIEGVSIGPDNKTIATSGHEAVVKLWDGATGRLLHTLTGHTTVVNMTKFLAGGKKLLSCSHDRTLRIWDVATGAQDAAIDTGHQDNIYSVAITPGEKQFVSCSWDKTIKVWDAGTHQEKSTLQPKRYRPDTNFPVLSVACSPDGKTLAVAGEERAIKLIDPKTGGIKHLLEGHEDVVAQVRFSPDGKMLASAGFDSKVILWSTQTGKPLQVYKGHASWVYCVAFSRDGATLASGGLDKAVFLWDTRTGGLIGTLKKHKGGVRALAFSRQGDLLATGSTDKTIRIWNLKDREVVHTLKGHEDAVRAVAFSPDDKRLASGGEDNRVRLWDIEREKEIGAQIFNDAVRDVAFSPRGATLACVCQDRSIRILDPMTAANRNTYYSHADAATSLAYAPDSQVLYTGSIDQSIRVWSADLTPIEARVLYRTHSGETWFALMTLDGKSVITGGIDNTAQVRPVQTKMVALKGYTGLVPGLACSPDGKWLATATADRSVRIWERATGKMHRRLLGHKHAVRAVAFSPDSKLLASCTGKMQDESEPGEIKIWDLKTGAEKCTLDGHTSVIAAVAFSPDGKTLASCGWDGTPRLWDVEAGKLRAALPAFPKGAVNRSLAFRPDGKMLAVVGMDGTIKLYDPPAAKEIATSKLPDAVLMGVAFSPDGTTLALARNPSNNPTDPLWGSKGVGSISLWDVATRSEIMRLWGHGGKVLSVAFSPDGSTIASGGNNGQTGEVKLHDWRSGRRLADLISPYQLNSLAFSPDGATLAGSGGSRETGEGVRLWDVAVERSRITLRGHTWKVNCAALSPDGKTLATGSFDKTIRLWDTTTWKCRSVLAGHTGIVRCMAFSPDGKTLASASDDTSVRLWDADKGAEKKVLTRHKIAAMSVAYSKDGRLIATSSSPEAQMGGEIRVFETATDKLITGAEWSNAGALSVAFSPDGNRLAAGGPGFPALNVYDVKSRKRVQSVQIASVRYLAFSPDGKTLATGHGQGGRRGNGGIMLWDTTRWVEKGFLRGHTGLCLSLSFSKDGRILGSGSADATARLWDLPAPAIAMRRP
jgi:WD40 repeat protein